jgi:hypothetical protein
MRHILFFSLITLFFAACSDDFFDQTISLDPPAYDLKMAVHADIDNNDSLLKVLISRNFGILEDVEDSLYFIENAKFELLEEGQVIWTGNSGTNPVQNYAYPPVIFSFDGGVFKSGKTYEFRTSHPNYTSISATQTMPNAVRVDSIRYREEAGISPGGDEVSAMDIYLKDEAGKANYYEIFVEYSYPIVVPRYDNNNQIVGYDTIGYNQNTAYPDGSTDPNVKEGVDNTLILSDQFIDGDDYKFVYQFYRYDFGSVGRFVVHVRAITQDAYAYKISAAQRVNGDENPFAQPVNIFGNMKNGIGIFSLAHEQTFIIQ